MALTLIRTGPYRCAHRKQCAGSCAAVWRRDVCLWRCSLCRRDKPGGELRQQSVLARRNEAYEAPRFTAIPLGQLLEKIKLAKASICAKVEHPFHIVKNLFRHCLTRYRGLAKNTAQMLTLFGMANLMLAKKRLITIHAQGAS